MTSSTAYIFPGQGSQVVGMGQALVAAHPARGTPSPRRTKFSVSGRLPSPSMARAMC